MRQLFFTACFLIMSCALCLSCSDMSAYGAQDGMDKAFSSDLPDDSESGSDWAEGTDSDWTDTGSPDSASDAGSGQNEDAQWEEVVDPDGGTLNEEIDGLAAGEWCDLEHWDFWRGLFEGPDSLWAPLESHWGFFTKGRISVEVMNGETPVVDAEVKLSVDGDVNSSELFKARTDNAGRASLFVNLFTDLIFYVGAPYVITAEKDGETSSVELDSVRPDVPVEIQLGASPIPWTLDIMFVFDTTGSMGDELSYFQAGLYSILDRISVKTRDSILMRVSVNFYRDEGDEYVLRPYSFTTSADRAVKQISMQSAEGGGDYAEAVEQALENAVFNHSWSESAVSRLLFLILDSPPRHKVPVLESIHQTVIEAAGKGIRIIPVAASGSSNETEFLMRFMDVVTGGTYIFLTRADSNADEDIKRTVGDFKVENLDDLIVRLVLDSIATD